MSDPSRQPNRLIHETSPYLVQHAHNPVDWYPWGEEALHRATELDRPIFLSIGYSACHWCHVMERESFEHPGIAQCLNDSFVSIKVDREERPDLDQIYMNAVMALSHRGGWPLSVFLTPDQKPFYGGTYFPPESRFHLPGFLEILVNIQHAWEGENRSIILNNAQELTSAVITMGKFETDDIPLSEEILVNALPKLMREADRERGGFGGSPKFPQTTALRFLLRCWKRFENREALEFVTHTLDRMASGGMYDHLGGGFHRYSTDANWLVPHFEKMLYDNALLTNCYLEAYQITNRSLYANVIRETLDYVLREMQETQGAYYSTQDADTDGEEGKFFVWDDAEIAECLEAEDRILFRSAYDVRPAGNWEGKTILNRVATDEELAERFGKSPQIVQQSLKSSGKQLFELRKKRTAPGLDEKILVSWNGLMIGTMAKAARTLNEERYLQSAIEAAEFIFSNLRTPKNRLWHTFKDGQAKLPAYLDDYAFLMEGLIELYQASFNERYLNWAEQLAEVMLELFEDQQERAFYFTSSESDTLICRNKESSDGAVPSANGTAAWSLLKLGELTLNSKWKEIATHTLQAIAGLIGMVPIGNAQALMALDWLLGPTQELVLVEGTDSNTTSEMLSHINSKFLPHALIAFRPPDFEESDDHILSLLFQGKQAKGNTTSIYLCEGEQCSLPITSATELAATLKKK